MPIYQSSLPGCLLPSLLYFPTSPSFISLCALRPDRALSPRRGSSALQERLHSSSPTNQFPLESVTLLLFYFLFLQRLSPPPFSRSTFLPCPVLPFCIAPQPSSLPALFKPSLLPPPVLPLFGRLLKFCLIRSMLSGDLFPFSTSHSLPGPCPFSVCLAFRWLEFMGTGGRLWWSILNCTLF